jgi:hypothetical protein
MIFYYHVQKPVELSVQASISLQDIVFGFINRVYSSLRGILALCVINRSVFI